MQKIEQILESHVSNGNTTKDRALGASFTVVNQNGTIYQCVAGRVGIALGSPDFTLDCSAWIASMTKLVTATALMQIVEKNVIRLDDDVRPLVPELAAAKILDPIAANDGIILKDNCGAITLRQLLTHTSGMGYDAVDPDLHKWASSTGRKDKTFDQTREGWNTPLKFAPGASWTYGSGIDWAGQVLERVTRQSLGDYMSENIFKPLGMDDTTFHRSASAGKLVEQTIECCYRAPDGSLVAGPSPVPENPPQDSGGAGLFSTARDYTTFIQALLSASFGQGTLLLRTSVEEMFRPQLNDSQSRDLQAFVHDLLPFPTDTSVNHGIGGVINLSNVDGKRRKGSLTWAGMNNSSWWIDRETGIAAVLFISILPPGDSIAKKLYDELERALYEDY